MSIKTKKIIEIEDILSETEKPLFLYKSKNGELNFCSEISEIDLTENDFLGKLPPVISYNIGSKTFRERYNVKYAYMTGAMANAIASEEMVKALSKAGILSSFGAAGLIPSRLEQAIKSIQTEAPKLNYAFNLIHSPTEEALERNGVELFLKHNIRVVEASAYMNITPYIVWYKASGLTNSNNNVVIQNRVIAKVSRLEVATKFMSPAPIEILNQLVNEGKITVEQSQLAQQVPLADDITVEADSGGHTDNRPLNCILPAVIKLRNELVSQYQFKEKIHIGAAGGIGTPMAAFGAFALGADYIVTGSINQACKESGSSEKVRLMLSQAEMTDITMAPAADMFEMGVKLQVLKRGTMFSNRAQKLYEIYKAYSSIDDIPTIEREKLEKQIFKKSLNEIWSDTIAFFKERDTELLELAHKDSKVKMALIFRWYLGLSSRWANIGEKGRELDYQIWCGPAMGAFNDWVKGTSLEKLENRNVVTIADFIMENAALLQREFLLKSILQ